MISMFQQNMDLKESFGEKLKRWRIMGLTVRCKFSLTDGNEFFGISFTAIPMCNTAMF